MVINRKQILKKELKLQMQELNVMRNKMKKFEHKMGRTKHVSLSNHW